MSRTDVGTGLFRAYSTCVTPTSVLTNDMVRCVVRRPQSVSALSHEGAITAGRSARRTRQVHGLARLRADADRDAGERAQQRSVRWQRAADGDAHGSLRLRCPLRLRPCGPQSAASIERMYSQTGSVGTGRRAKGTQGGYGFFLLITLSGGAMSGRGTLAHG